MPLLIGLECHFCTNCRDGFACPAKIETISSEYGIGRMTNLIAVWHGQLIEVMGAMGMREAVVCVVRPAVHYSLKTLRRKPLEGFLARESGLKEVLPENTIKTLVPQVEVTREVKPAPSRYRNEIAKYIIRRSSDCKLCGKCAQVCPHGVHVLKPGYKLFSAPA